MLYTDADLPFEMIELVRAIRVLRTYEADMVSAYRLDRTGEGLRRAVYSWVYNWLIQLSFGTRLRAGVGRPSLVCTPSSPEFCWT